MIVRIKRKSEKRRQQISLYYINSERVTRIYTMARAYKSKTHSIDNEGILK